MKLLPKPILALISQSKKFEFIIGMLALLILISAFAIPELYAYFHLKPFTWQNAWDNCTYLSYQAALGYHNAPGYFALYIIEWLQKLGIAGSTQAILYSLTLPTLIVFLCYRIFLQAKIEQQNALFYALVIVFSSVLFNYANPHISYHFQPPEHFAFLSIGWATFPVILRAPNPVFSYLFIALSIYLTQRFRNFLFLLLPIPFLYYFVFAPYVYLIILIFLLYRTSWKPSILATISINVVVFILLSLLIWLLFIAVGISTSHVNENIDLYAFGHHAHLNLVGCLGILGYFLLKINGFFKSHLRLESYFISLIFTSFAITNLQVINGFALDLKNYQDYGNNIIGALLLVLTHFILNQAKDNYNYDNYAKKILTCIIISFKYCILFFVIKYTLLSQGFNFNTHNFSINLGPSLSKKQLEQIKIDPIHAIILDQQLTEYLPFSQTKMLAPVLSYQYNYSFIEKQCQYNLLLTKNALNYINKNCRFSSTACADLKERANLYLSNQKQHVNVPYHNQPYCSYSYYAKKGFYFISPDNSHSTVIFPNWEL